ncbi:MAG: thioredoxin family protein [Bacteroidales bacterium]|nr:thioredoxin family protein [Bacteroidales bacterium]
MRKGMLLAAACLCLLIAAEAQPPLKKVYDEAVNPMEQIDRALAEANAAGKFVVCQVGGNWCPWCLRFAAFVEGDSTIRQLVERHFVYIHVNYHPKQLKSPETKQQAQQLLQRLGNPARFGFPVFVILDQSGKVIHIQDSSFLEEGEGYDRKKVLRFFQAWTPKAVGSDA